MIGESVERTFQLENPHTSPIWLEPTLPNGPFAIISPRFPFTMPPGGSVTVTVHYTPIATTTSTGEISWDSLVCPTLVLSGTGVNPSCVPRTQEIDFGPVVLGASSSMDFYLVNESSAPVSPQPILSLPDFSAGLGDLPIAPQDSALLTITFAPQELRTRSGEVVFAGGVCPPIIVTGWGEGVACELEPASIAFGSSNYLVRPTRTISLRNTGTLPISGALEVEGSFAVLHAPEYSLEPDEQVSLDVEFRPSTSGTYSGRMLVEDLCSVVLSAQATRTWVVGKDGSAELSTIQAGIDSAMAGDTVQVRAGTYFENLTFSGRDVVVIGESGPFETVVDGRQGLDQAVVLFDGGESHACHLQGFTITGGRGHRLETGGYSGSGIVCVSSSPTIRGNVIADNLSPDQFNVGAGLCAIRVSGSASHSVPRIVGNIFSANSAGTGGALFATVGADTLIVVENLFESNESNPGDGAGVFMNLLSGGRSILLRNVFFRNQAADHGGAIMISGNGGATEIIHNVIAYNSADGVGIFDDGTGGGIYTSRQIGSITHNTIAYNTAGGESAFNGGGIQIDDPSNDLRISGNIIAFNSDAGLACSGDQHTIAFGPNLLWSNGSDLGGGQRSCPAVWLDDAVFADPLFCNPASDDFSLSAQSPAFREVPLGAIPTSGCD